MAEDPRPRIRAFIVHLTQGIEMSDDEDFTVLGYVNSLGALQIVQFVEQEFGIAVDEADLDWDNFRSIAAIARFVERHTST